MKITVEYWAGWNPLKWGFCGSRGVKRIFFDTGQPGFYTIGPALVQVEWQ